MLIITTEMGFSLSFKCHSEQLFLYSYLQRSFYTYSFVVKQILLCILRAVEQLYPKITPAAQRPQTLPTFNFFTVCRAASSELAAFGLTQLACLFACQSHFLQLFVLNHYLCTDARTHMYVLTVQMYGIQFTAFTPLTSA